MTPLIFDTELSEETLASVHREEENGATIKIKILLFLYQFTWLLFPENYNFIERPSSLAYLCISHGAIYFHTNGVYTCILSTTYSACTHETLLT